MRWPLMLVATLLSCVPRGLVEDAKDRDGDGFAAWELGGDDCDDARPTVNVDADEVCGNERDDDCDGDVDEAGLGATTWYEDIDRDGWGNDDVPRSACAEPFGFVAAAGDCADLISAVNPGVEEECGNDRDDDCDDVVDDAGLGDSTWYRDDDGDGYGLLSSATDACEAPAQHVATPGDCDDTKEAVSPAQQEICANDLDDDCDEAIDDRGIGEQTWYRDQDGDGYGLVEQSTAACTAPQGHATLPGDCDDALPTVKPGVAEVCNNGRDDNCDGSPSPCELRGVVSLAAADVKIRGTTAQQRFGGSLAVGYLDANSWTDLLIGAGHWGISVATPGAMYALTTPLDVTGVLSSTSLPSPLAPGGLTAFAFELATCDVNGDGRAEVFTPWKDGEWVGTFPDTIVARIARFDANQATSGVLPTPTSVTAVLGDPERGLDLVMCSTDGQSIAFIEGGSPRRLLVFDNLVDIGLIPDDADGQLSSNKIFYPLAFDDVDADDVNDLLLGFPTDSRVIVVAGVSGALSEGDAWLSISLPGAGSTGFVGDIDDDLDADIIVIATATGGNAAYGFLGPFAPGAVLTADDASFSVHSRVGASLSSIGLVGDLNGDGVNDWCARSPFDDRGEVDAGALYCWYGAQYLEGEHSVEEADIWIVGEGPSDGVASGFLSAPFNPKLAGGIDVNRDGYDDLVIGEPHADVSGNTDAGTVYVVWGRGM